MGGKAEEPNKPSMWSRKFHRPSSPKRFSNPEKATDELSEIKAKPTKWSLGILNDRETDEVPGSILLLPNCRNNAPLGLREAPARRSASSLPSPYPPGLRPPFSRTASKRSAEERKTTRGGAIILVPQPDESMNDPLNWPSWRRDVALLSLGFYCMLGGGMTPILAAGFDNVAATYQVSIPQVALTTGLFMMGLGIGSVVASPTAILFGKRPVYLLGIILFSLSSVWCAVSPNYPSLVVARIFMGLAVSPVECLPSATIAEIFFLHERAYRLGIYTLLLLSGKNLIPLVSAAIIQGLSWQWVFWIVAMIVGFCLFLMFFFVPETFWDRTPRPHSKNRFASLSGLISFSAQENGRAASTTGVRPSNSGMPPLEHEDSFVRMGMTSTSEGRSPHTDSEVVILDGTHRTFDDQAKLEHRQQNTPLVRTPSVDAFGNPAALRSSYKVEDSSPSGYFDHGTVNEERNPEAQNCDLHSPHFVRQDSTFNENSSEGPSQYTTYLRSQPTKTFKQTLKPWNGRLCLDNWFLVAFRPFVLFAYPAILWSTLVYSLSIGWLIVLSESMSYIFRNKERYNFSSLGTGLVYISPFIGGILGTVVAGKVSDIIVRFMSRRNGGVYEPEFRLIMAVPVAVCTCIGLMGFGWSAAEKDRWIVPTVFFGIISFGCSLGSTTAITFAVDSYRQYAGEALVTLNFSKNIFHGLVFSLFFNRWLEADGSKKVFIAIGGIQLACLLTTVPMYIYGKRARMWTTRKNLMEKF